MKKFLCLCLILILCLISCSIEKSEDTSKSAFTPKNFTGEWSRTNIPKALTATTKIINQKEYSFDFDFEGMWALHGGNMKGTATIVSPTTAEYSYKIEYPENSGEGKIVFILENNVLKISANPDTSSALGFGANVTIGGDYVSGKPFYTNENIVNEVFTTDIIKQKVELLMGEKNYKWMIDIMNYGFSYSQSDKEQPLTYSGFYNGTGTGVDIMIKGENFYILFYTVGYTLYTNDKTYQNKLPEFFNANPTIEIDFIYKFD